MNDRMKVVRACTREAIERLSSAKQELLNESKERL